MLFLCPICDTPLEGAPTGFLVWCTVCQVRYRKEEAYFGRLDRAAEAYTEPYTVLPPL